MTDRHAHRRCVWANGDPLMQTYHDEEWGVPERDPRALWEMLMLEGFQAGLAWIIVLRKREAFRQAFAGFDPDRVARFTKRDIDRLMNNAGIIRAHSRSRRRSRARASSVRCAIEARISAHCVGRSRKGTS